MIGPDGLTPANHILKSNNAAGFNIFGQGLISNTAGGQTTSSVHMRLYDDV